MSKITRKIGSFTIHSETPKFGKPRYYSKYRELFTSMKKGEWFYVSNKDYGKLSNAASMYLKGKYSFRRASNKRQYILQKTV